MAISYATKDAVYLSNCMSELHLLDNFSNVLISSDSIGALIGAANSMYASRTKHIALSPPVKWIMRPAYSHG